MMEKITIEEELKELAKLFPPTKKLYIVGGFVRDFLMNGNVKKDVDIDVCASLSPQELQQLLIGTSFSTVEASARLGTVIIKGKRKYEYTTFRKDSYPQNSGIHTPSEVTFTDDILQDCLRRDFRCNAIYYSPIDEEFVDLLDGKSDIEKHILQTTRCAKNVLEEDGLRIMRLFRFVSTLGFDIEKQTWQVCKEKSELLRDISVERIAVELVKILDGEFVGKALRLMRDSGVLKEILPQLSANDKVAQNIKYHKYDVLEHIFVTVENCKKEIRLAALFHDIAKKYCQDNFGNSYDHAKVGAKMTKDILSKYKFSNKIVLDTARLVENHMFGVGGKARPSTIRRFAANNFDIIDDIIELKRADNSARGMESVGTKPNIAEQMQSAVNYIKEKQLPTKISDLAIGGKELVDCGLKGKKIKEALENILDMCIIENLENEKQCLTAYIDKHFRIYQGEI